MNEPPDLVNIYYKYYKYYLDKGQGWNDGGLETGDGFHHEGLKCTKSINGILRNCGWELVAQAHANKADGDADLVIYKPSDFGLV